MELGVGNVEALKLGSCGQGSNKGIYCKKSHAIAQVKVFK